MYALDRRRQRRAGRSRRRCMEGCIAFEVISLRPSTSLTPPPPSLPSVPSCHYTTPRARLRVTNKKKIKKRWSCEEKRNTRAAEDRETRQDNISTQREKQDKTTSQHKESNKTRQHLNTKRETRQDNISTQREKQDKTTSQHKERNKARQHLNTRLAISTPRLSSQHDACHLNTTLVISA